ncbi:hypothetical protein KC722_00925 [Candidatus Kaiserbacteria bacterium]|nr:hypothetical protein [Candidatus Kaiserbacteria bacterium]
MIKPIATALFLLSAFVIFGGLWFKIGVLLWGGTDYSFSWRFWFWLGVLGITTVYCITAELLLLLRQRHH